MINCSLYPTAKSGASTVPPVRCSNSVTFPVPFRSRQSLSQALRASSYAPHIVSSPFGTLLRARENPPIITHNHTVNCLILTQRRISCEPVGTTRKSPLRDLRAILRRRYLRFDVSTCVGISDHLDPRPITAAIGYILKNANTQYTPPDQYGIVEPWIQQDWTDAEIVLAGEIPRLSRPVSSGALAYRPLVLQECS